MPFPIVPPEPPREKKLDVAFVLTDGRNTVVRTRRELGFRLAAPSGPITFTVDTIALTGALHRLAPAFRQEAIDARPHWSHGRLTILPGAFARHLDVAATAQRLAETVRAHPATHRLGVSLAKTPPVLTPARLKGITGILTRFTTHAGGTAKRSHNIALAVQSIDGTLLSPGERFSLNEIVGKRTQARGYRTATVFVDAKTAPGVGGGVSQVTGTLFNAAALAGLPILEAHPHSRPVHYLPIGRDATVEYGYKDLKFVNDTRAPIFVEYDYQGSALTATLYGAPIPGRKVTLTPHIRTKGPGKIDADLYRTIREKGRVIRKERLLHHAYRWTPG